MNIEDNTAKHTLCKTKTTSGEVYQGVEDARYYLRVRCGFVELSRNIYTPFAGMRNDYKFYKVNAKVVIE